MMRRNHPRFTVQVPVSFTGHHDGMAALVDLSKAGCRMKKDADVRIEPNDVIAMRLYLSFDASPVQVDAAIVRWSTERDLGVEFIIMDSEEQERLQYHLAQLSTAVH
jgi:hypothetical protein